MGLNIYKPLSTDVIGPTLGTADPGHVVRRHHRAATNGPVGAARRRTGHRRPGFERSPHLLVHDPGRPARLGGQLHGLEEVKGSVRSRHQRAGGFETQRLGFSSIGFSS